MKDINNIICCRRSIRRFKQDPIPEKILLNMINAARLAPSGANIQPCQFIIVNDPDLVKNIFPHLKWAAYIKPFGDPPEGERPVVFIAVLIDLNMKFEKGEVDAAAAIQNILITACGYDIGTCWLKSINKNEICRLLNVPDSYKLDSIIAVGYKNEEPVIDESKGSIKYWKDSNGKLHVPKRRLSEILYMNKFQE